MGKAHNFPGVFGKISPKFRTPAYALLGNMLVGLLALFSGRTGEIITLSVFGALTLYVIAMVAIIRLRKVEPTLHRPFRVPLFPLFPMTVLVIGILSLITMFVYNWGVGLIYLLILFLSYCLFKVFKR